MSHNPGLISFRISWCWPLDLAARDLVLGLILLHDGLGDLVSKESGNLLAVPVNLAGPLLINASADRCGHDVLAVVIRLERFGFDCINRKANDPLRSSVRGN